MKLKLVVLSEGKLKGQGLPITSPQFFIGRDPRCHLRPNSPAISKRHCAVFTKAGKVFVRDFASTNGTFINNVKVEGDGELQHDDVLKVGPLEFRVEVERSTPVDKPTPRPGPPRDAMNEDEDVADLLLAMQDESSSGLSGASPDSTVHDFQAPRLSQAATDTKPELKKVEPPKEPLMKPSDAAKLALEKLLRGGTAKKQQ